MPFSRLSDYWLLLWLGKALNRNQLWGEKKPRYFHFKIRGWKTQGELEIGGIEENHINKTKIAALFLVSFFVRIERYLNYLLWNNFTLKMHCHKP